MSELQQTTQTPPATNTETTAFNAGRGRGGGRGGGGHGGRGSDYLDKEEQVISMPSLTQIEIVN